MEMTKGEPARQRIIILLVLMQKGEFKFQLLLLDRSDETAVPNDLVDKWDGRDYQFGIMRSNDNRSLHIMDDTSWALVDSPNSASLTFIKTDIYYSNGPSIVLLHTACQHIA